MRGGSLRLNAETRVDRRISINSLVNPTENDSDSRMDVDSLLNDDDSDTAPPSLYDSPTISEREALYIEINVTPPPQTPAGNADRLPFQDPIIHSFRALQLQTPPPSRTPTPILPPSPLSNPLSLATPRLPHSNQPYDIQELDWIKYHKEDCNSGSKTYQWKDMVKKYKETFPEAIPRDTPAALNSRYYRTNMYPVLDADGRPVLDSKGQVIRVKVNPKGAKSGKTPTAHYMQLRRLGYFSLVSAHPERAMRYWWVKEHDKERAREILRRRKAAGLPASVPYYDYLPRQTR